MTLSHEPFTRQPAGERPAGYVESPSFEARKARVLQRDGCWCPCCEGSGFVQDPSSPRVGQRCDCALEVLRAA